MIALFFSPRTLGTISMAAVMLIAACSPSSDLATPATDDATATDPQVSTLEPEDSPGQSQAALPVGAGALIAVKVDNAPAARPQIGIEAAVLLTEVEVEGGVTRLTAFFKPGALPGLIGPVRSVRPVDADLLSAFGSLVISTGGQPWVVAGVEAAGVRSIAEIEANGFQLLDRQAPHNIFAVPVQLVGRAEVVERTGFAEGSWPGGAAAQSITIPFPELVVWDFVDGRYVRQDFDVAVDVEAGQMTNLSADTVVVMLAAKRSAGYTDATGAQVPTFDVVGSGRLFVFHNGEMIEGMWARSAQADSYELVSDDGAELPIPVGRVYLAVLDRELTPEF